MFAPLTFVGRHNHFPLNYNYDWTIRIRRQSCQAVNINTDSFATMVSLSYFIKNIMLTKTSFYLKDEKHNARLIFF